MPEFHFTVTKDEDGDPKVTLEGEDGTYEDYLNMAGFMCFMVARESGYGFEKTLEDINLYAMTFKRKFDA